MNISPLVSFALLLVSSLAARAAVIADEAFDNPTEITYAYPTPEGVQPTYHGLFSAWTKGGSIGVTYGGGLGTQGSGGMLCTLDAASDLYMFFMLNDVVLPISDPAYATVEQIKSYVAAFDARIPAGKTLEVSLIAKPSDPAMKARSDASRLQLGRVTGTGEYMRYTLPAAKTSEQSIRAFLQLLRDISLNGEHTLKVDLRWTLLGRTAVWKTGDSIQVDNILLTVGE